MINIKYAYKIQHKQQYQCTGSFYTHIPHFGMNIDSNYYKLFYFTLNFEYFI